jgi:uncharacterized protein YdeI (YjbR/CyaY-like superfamily)
MKKVHPKTREDWRKWLKLNHQKEKSALVVLYKKHTKKPSPSSRELMHEAICWGWIDTTAHRIDENKCAIKYTRRNEKTSKWSKNTLRYGKELTRQGLMSPHGLKMYKLGLKKKPHDYNLSDNPKMPKSLKQELTNKGLLDKFLSSTSPSQRRMHYRLILRAKLPETKMKRINMILKTLKNTKR